MEFAYSPIEQFVHVSLEGAPMAAEYVPLLQLVHPDAPRAEMIDHVPVKPLEECQRSDVKVTLRNPVDELYSSDKLTDDPESRLISSPPPGSHAAVSHA